MPIADRLQNILQHSSIHHLDACWGNVDQSQTFRFDQPGAEDSHTPAAARDTRRYLVASLTKPIVAMAAVRLAADGEFGLNERITRFLPAFNRAAYRRITLRHLLTHTSGLPDMLPDNTELRSNHAPLARFVERASEVELEFATGTESRYASVGLLLLGSIIESITGESLPKHLQQQFFEPLQMNETWLGLPAEQADQMLPTVLPSLTPHWQSDAAHWGWNSRYWRTLGAPWGGLISTATDLATYAQLMLNEGRHQQGHLLPPVAVRASVRDQVSEIAGARSGDVVGSGRRSWGFGWRLQWETHAASFGDFWSPQSYGHWGATGTMLCIDPVSNRFAVILTTTPYEESRSTIQHVANCLATAPLDSR